MLKAKILTVVVLWAFIYGMARYLSAREGWR